MRYNAIILDHYENPRNVGEFNVTEKNIVIAFVGSEAKGDVVQLQLKINEKNIIEAVKFKAQSSVVTVAICSWLTEQLPGKSIVEAGQLTHQKIATALQLPPLKIHCAVLVETALKSALSHIMKS